MQFFSRNINTRLLLVIGWGIVFVISFLTASQYDPPVQSITNSFITVAFYALIIYGNTYWLIPKFYTRKKYVAYVVLALVLLAVDIVARTLVSLYVYNAYFAITPEPLSARGFKFSAFSAMFIFLFSILLRLALDYFALYKKQSAIQAEKTQTELALLKQQLHPHFLFNTLNNIYYVAGKGSPEAADLIERLSGIMRYFIEEAQKEKALLKDEVALLKSYIDLESIRMRYEMPVSFTINGNTGNIAIPPLLLMPLIENIFKHGVDKRSQNNFAEVTLVLQNNSLLFSTKNMYYTSNAFTSSKTGLANLTKRLQLYYGSNYTLTAQQEGDVFITLLQIPINED